MSKKNDITGDMPYVNVIRALAVDTIDKANSGHPGLPLGAAPMAYALWRKHLRHNPLNPAWADRDRFVLSAGHGSALLYSMLHLFGYSVAIDDLKSFRQPGSITPGHPEFRLTPGVEATTGPLGQGSANAVGMAIAERSLAHRFNRPGHSIVDHYTYALVSDGDLMEGISAEASALAGHLKLGKLIFLYDANDISLDGPSSLSFSTEDVEKRYAAYGWQTIRVEDGNNDLAGIDKAISKAKKDTTRPSIIIVRTTIGCGSPNKQGSCKAHGAPLGPDETALTKKNLGCDPEKTFCVSPEVYAHFAQSTEAGKRLEKKWQKAFFAYCAQFPELAAEWKRTMSGEPPENWDANIPVFATGESLATRVASGKALNAVAGSVPEFMGGDADLSESTKSAITGGGDFNGQTGEGRNIHFGVREHAMASIANGMSYHGGARPYVSTFFVFSDYMRPSIRLAAMNKLPVIYVLTHDSIAVGEDGPTHQPVEHLMSLRLIPNVTVVRPADANETSEAWKLAMRNTTGPTILVLSRQNLPTLDRDKLGAAAQLHKGAYILSGAPDENPDCVIIATGSEVEIALSASETLSAQGIKARVVSMPCMEAFTAQSDEYKESVLPAAVKKRVSVEAGSTFGWSRWTGDAGVSIGINKYGASGPADKILAGYGMTADNIVAAVKKIL